MFPDYSTCTLKGTRHASERESSSKAIVVAQGKVDGQERIVRGKYLKSGGGGLAGSFGGACHS